VGLGSAQERHWPALLVSTREFLAAWHALSSLSSLFTGNIVLVLHRSCLRVLLLLLLLWRRKRPAQAKDKKSKK
jgi:hypothetical protein